MGIFDDYNIDIETVKENNFDVADGTYLFEIAEAEVLDGTQNKPDTTFFIIDYQLEDEDGDAAGQKRAWYTLAEDGDSGTKRAVQSVSFLKGDLVKLGLRGASLAGFDGSELVGIKGTLMLKTGPGKNGNPGFQNIRVLNVEKAEAPAPKAAPARKPRAAAKPAAEDDAAVKARVKAKQAARVEETEDDEDDPDNPFGND